METSMETYSHFCANSGEFAEQVDRMLYSFNPDPDEPRLGGLFIEIWLKASGTEIAARRNYKSYELTHMFIQNNEGETGLIQTRWYNDLPFLNNQPFFSGIRVGKQRTTIVLKDKDKTVVQKLENLAAIPLNTPESSGAYLRGQVAVDQRLIHEHFETELVPYVHSYFAVSQELTAPKAFTKKDYAQELEGGNNIEALLRPMMPPNSLQDLLDKFRR